MMFTIERHLTAIAIALMGVGMVLFGQSASAAVWTWNSSTSGSPVDGGGAWNTTSANWWNGTTDTMWTTGSNAAFFGAAAGSTAYSIDIGSGSISTGGV